MNDGTENRFTVELATQIHKALDQVEQQPGPSALITTGHGRFFSNGIPLDQSIRNAPIELTLQLYALLSRLLTFPVPTIACVNGHAYGAGAMLVLAHDYSVMNATHGWIGYPLLKIGLVLPIPLVELANTKLKQPRLVRDLFLQAKRLTGTEAHALGFVDDAAPPHDLMATAMRQAASVAPFGLDRAVYGGLKLNMYANAVRLLGVEGSSHPLDFKASL